MKLSKSKSRKKRRLKRVLALPDLEHAKTAVLTARELWDHAMVLSPRELPIITSRAVTTPA
jgi:hypothetical protein